MAPRIVYGGGLWLFLATFAMTMAAIIIPEWISWDIQEQGSKHVHYTYGLHARCSSIDEKCYPFPREENCHGIERDFCSAWRTSAFFMSLSVVFEIVTCVAFGIMLLGGKQKRDRGWRIVCGCLLICACAQAVAWGTILHLFEDDARFQDGWRLDKSFVLCAVSWMMQTGTAVAMGIAVYVLPEEGGYELIPDNPVFSS